jgi:hypothetical protein
VNLKKTIILFFICIFTIFASSNIIKQDIFPLYIDSSFSKEEMAAIMRAADLWTTSTDSRVKFEFTPTNKTFKPFEYFDHSMSPTIWRATPNPNLFFFEMIIVGSPILGFASKSILF